LNEAATILESVKVIQEKFGKKEEAKEEAKEEVTEKVKNEDLSKIDEE
jgi:hypothetical protein